MLYGNSSYGSVEYGGLIKEEAPAAVSPTSTLYGPFYGTFAGPIGL